MKCLADHFSGILKRWRTLCRLRPFPSGLVEVYHISENWLIDRKRKAEKSPSILNVFSLRVKSIMMEMWWDWMTRNSRNNQKRLLKSREVCFDCSNRVRWTRRDLSCHETGMSESKLTLKVTRLARLETFQRKQRGNQIKHFFSQFPRRKLYIKFWVGKGNNLFVHLISSISLMIFLQTAS